jgi:hypothetical protein
MKKTSIRKLVIDGFEMCEVQRENGVKAIFLLKIFEISPHPLPLPWPLAGQAGRDF